MTKRPPGDYIAVTTIVRILDRGGRSDNELVDLLRDMAAELVVDALKHGITLEIAVPSAVVIYSS